MSSSFRYLTIGNRINSPKGPINLPAFEYSLETYLLDQQFLTTIPGSTSSPLMLMLYVAVSQIIHETVMSIYSGKLHVQVVINCRYSVAKMCTREDMLALKLGLPYFDDVLFGQVSTSTGGYQLPIFPCTNVHL